MFSKSKLKILWNKWFWNVKRLVFLFIHLLTLPKYKNSVIPLCVCKLTNIGEEERALLLITYKNKKEMHTHLYYCYCMCISDVNGIEEGGGGGGMEKLSELVTSSFLEEKEEGEKTS